MPFDENRIFTSRIELEEAEELERHKARMADIKARAEQKAQDKAEADAGPKDVQVFPYNAEQVDAATAKLTPSPAAKLFESRPAADPIANPNGRGWTEDFFTDLQRKRIIERLAAGDYKDPSHRDLDVERLEQIRVTTGR
jgi:hypothetical protein